jgi:formylglycine-generating enzyme required for sulfatase activity
MIRLPGGTFTMGSTSEEIDAAISLCRSLLSEPERSSVCQRVTFEDEGPPRAVTLDPFAIDTTEVSVRRFADWLNDQKQQPGAGLLIAPDSVEELRHRWVSLRGQPIYDLFDRVPPDRNGLAGGIDYDGQRFVVRPGRENKPIVQVSWYGAKAFCEAQGQRLPTEAEWEYAARPGGHDRFPWGDSLPRCADVVFTRSRGDSCSGDTGTRDVGYSPQDITVSGIKDLGGNASEWVADVYRPSYAPCAGACLNPLVDLGPTDPKDTHRVHRGGNWAWPPSHLRSALRGHSAPSYRDQVIGFRCALSI